RDIVTREDASSSARCVSAEGSETERELTGAPKQIPPRPRVIVHSVNVEAWPDACVHSQHCEEACQREQSIAVAEYNSKKQRKNKVRRELHADRPCRPVQTVADTQPRQQ